MRPGVHTGLVLPVPTKAISRPNGESRETVRVLPLTSYATWSGRLEEGSHWKPGWLLGVHYSAIDMIPRGTAYFEVTNPTSPIALGAGATLGHNLGQLYVMSGLVHGRASVFGVARATSHRETRETVDATNGPLTSTTAVGGGFEVPLLRSISLRTVAEMTQGRRSLPGGGGEIRQWVVTMALGWRN
ncbi:MAG: hypothetical protein SFW08_12765 [Gemmatimonadaceae bacterium]|nr:hypothetical protein [Gemmatimonadaceae bacterium]